MRHSQSFFTKVVMRGRASPPASRGSGPETDVKTLDALHIASAVMFQAVSGLTVPFITSHATERDAAQAMGLIVIWVE
jgi:hypothetical protein